MFKNVCILSFLPSILYGRISCLHTQVVTTDLAVATVADPAAAVTAGLAVVAALGAMVPDSTVSAVAETVVFRFCNIKCIIHV